MRVPVVMVTGFLGAGKTTLINRLLARRAERGEEVEGKLGVIVNELGAIGVDGALLGAGGARQVELPGGCVCCVRGDDLDRTLIEMIDANPELEAIVLETTGAAEPPPIAWALERPPVSERARLASVVTLVDAENVARSRPLSVAVDAQIAYADAILVTKSPPGNPDDARAIAAELAPRAVLRIASTDDHAAWLEQLLAEPDLTRVGHVVDGVGEHHVHDEHCRHVDTSHAHGIDSVWTSITSVVDLEELEDRLAELPGNYIRIKGIAHARDGRVGGLARRVVIHRVGLRVSSEPYEGLPGAPDVVVALGPGVRADELTACIEASALHDSES